MTMLYIDLIAEIEVAAKNITTVTNTLVAELLEMKRQRDALAAMLRRVCEASDLFCQEDDCRKAWDEFADDLIAAYADARALLATLEAKP